MRIRLFNCDQRKIERAERLLYQAAVAVGEEWRFACVSERLEVARQGVPPQAVGLEADGQMLYVGPLDNEATAAALVEELLERKWAKQRRILAARKREAESREEAGQAE